MACVPVLLAGGLDWLTWGQPFRSFWLNIYLNVIVGVSSGAFGAVPAIFYMVMLLADWLWSFAAVLLFASRGARALPFVALAALSILAEHSLIPHKEFRFIFPATALIIPLAGVGLAASWRHFSTSRRILVGVFLLSGAFASPLVPINLLMQTTAYQLSNELAQLHPCIVAMDIADGYFIPVTPIFNNTAFTNAPYAAEADAIIAPKNVGGIPPGFVRQSCVARNRGPLTGRGPQICYWIKPAGWCQETKLPPPFELIFPPAARRYIIAGH